jgi:DUF1365 family protein
MHARLRPRAHRFAYRVFSILIDLDRLVEADRASPLFSVDRFNLLSFHQKDHGPGDGSCVRNHVHGLLRSAGCSVDGGRVLLFCYPRVLGTVFNPLSVYFAFDPQGRPAGIVYEVRNTFGERHSYAVPLRGETGPFSHRCAKAFHVSPFLGMDHRYLFRTSLPEDRFRLSIQVEDAAGPVLCTAVSARRRPLTTREILAAFGRVPLLAATVIGGIHWEALRLWLKGQPVHPHPDRAAPEGKPAGSGPR